RAGRYQAEVEPIEEGAIQGSPERIEDIATRFKAYAEAHNLKVLDSWPPLRQLHDSGRVADIVAQHLPLSMNDRQAVLATLDPIARLDLVLSHINV
ncbi:MAG: LON peptidase substrate-binding domain-containing protein, partial [Sphingomonadales bacterium]|nr:LON peptidase substrate-binding domain-containing protein [Sphingomonadales bacterium]